MFTYYLRVLMAHACFCLRVFGFSPTNGTKRAERPQNQNRFWISQQFEGQNTAGHDLRRLSLSQAPCLGAPDNISALLSPRFYCERLQIHLPNNAPIHDAQPLGPHFAHMASEVPLDIENKAEMFGSHVPRFILMPPTSQILLVCDALGHLRAGQPRGGQHFRVPRRLNLPDSAD